jgi:hypothetical protein
MNVSGGYAMDNNIGRNSMEIKMEIFSIPHSDTVNNVIIEVASSKEVISAGDDFFLKYRIANNSLESITVLPNIVNRTHCFSFFNQDMEDISWGANMIIEFGFDPKKNDFISIMPDHVLEASIQIRCGQGPVYIATQGKYYTGLYLYINKTESFFLLDEAQAVKIRGRYYLAESERNNMLKYGFEDGIVDELYSDVITLQIITDRE